MQNMLSNDRRKLWAILANKFQNEDELEWVLAKCKSPNLLKINFKFQKSN